MPHSDAVTGSAHLFSSQTKVETRILLEPEENNISEQLFSASLETAPATTPAGNARFELHRDIAAEPPAKHADGAGTQVLALDEPAADCELGDVIASSDPAAPSKESVVLPAQLAEDMSAGECEQPDFLDPDWRQEVSARVHKYRSRRHHRPPRYPSLSLKFDSPERGCSPASRSFESPRMPASVETAVRSNPQQQEECDDLALGEVTLAHPLIVEANSAELRSEPKIIEFPRPLLPPPSPADELATPVLDKPRILDAPEAVPKQVPLGGILLEEQEPLKPPALELPLQVASLSSRFFAAAVDGLVVLTASVMFGYIVARLSPVELRGRSIMFLAAVLPSTLWMTYQYLALVHAGATPGLRVARLRLSRFDGNVPSKKLRRWRALFMALSALSLGLGFFWCLLDQDTLCWHDRITRTYLMPADQVSRS